MAFDLGRSLRLLKPQRQAPPLRRRLDGHLTFVEQDPSAGPELLLDATVYVDVLKGATPPNVDRLLRRRILNHSTVVLAELTHLFGRLDPTHRDTKTALAALRRSVDAIPDHRLSSPSTEAFGKSGMLAGMASRLAGLAPDQALLNDALILLQANESGRVVLTRNVADFDRLQQLVPGARVTFYRNL